jgi:membrane fusion protein (multidrug efflux system)
MRRIAIIPLLILFVLGGAIACKGGGGQAGPGGGPGGPGGEMKLPVETAKAAVMSLPAQFETIGSLRAEASVVVRPEVAGKIVTIHFQEGQRVDNGAPLFSLDPALAQASLNEANANLENSHRAFGRASELANRQLIAHADLDTRKATLGVDQARAATARTMLDKTAIRAPFAGVVGLREASVGDYVNVGQALVDLVRLDPMEVDFSVPEVELARIAVGQTVKLEVDAVPGKTFDGTVLAVDPIIDAAGRSAKIRARVPNPELTLRPGLFARLRIVYGTNPTALMIPEQAIWPDGDQKKVFRVDNGKVTLVPVTLGMRQPGMVQVVDGLKAGDEIVTAGQMKLHDGMGVMPLPSADASDHATSAPDQPSVPAAKPDAKRAASGNGG